MTSAQITGRAQVRGGLVHPGRAAAQPPVVELDPRPAYDFLAAACEECGELDDLLPEDRRWLVDSRVDFKTLPSHGDWAGAGACAGLLLQAGAILVRRPEIRTARRLVDAIDALSDHELTEMILGELLWEPEYSDATVRALDGDGAAYDEVNAKLLAHKGEAMLPERFADIAPAARRAAHFWLPRYEPREPRMARMLERDAARLRAVDSAGDPIGFIERATAGVRLIPEPGVRRVVLAPTYFGRPYNSLTRVGDATLIYYPIADGSLDSADRLTPPNSTLRLYRALGDRSRLRILKLLGERDRYLTEIANELDLSKPTINHHLATLRAAGLVTVTEQGPMMFYSLRRDRAEEAGAELRAFLAH
jgi:DNA-binding transcriptional ArsR family regulator